MIPLSINAKNDDYFKIFNKKCQKTLFLKYILNFNFRTNEKQFYTPLISAFRRL